LMENITIHKSEEAGIAFVHQELNLFNDMTVWENIYLNKEITSRFGRVNKKAMAEKMPRAFPSA
ncbi:MAG: hypothetical protein IJG51_09185, partial [Synergistaceae bacterium]|nr:hypothetical protein [Synergistaceae bacterium]